MLQLMNSKDMNGENYIEEDLEKIFNSLAFLIEKLKGKKIFITGGRGFFGSWFLEFLRYANIKRNLDIKATILTRNIAEFKRSKPHLIKYHNFKLHSGDIKNFKFLDESYDYFIHLGGQSYGKNVLSLFDVITQGTRHALDYAVQCNVKNFLFLSSGGIYGRNIAIQRISENLDSIPLIDNIPIQYVEYGLAKRIGEFFVYVYSNNYNIESKIARCFTFIGPYIPLDSNFAAGNFIRDAMNGGPIIVKGDGTAVRSYMYMSDLIIWLWTILFKGKNCEPYNVGSEAEITIKELAFRVADIYRKLTGKTVDVIIEKIPDQSKPLDRYVPSTKKATEELGLKQTVFLDEAIERTLKFYLSL